MSYTALALTCLLSFRAHADDWPQWRGPNRDGVWKEKGIIEKFDGPRLQPLWQAQISNGYSGPTVAKGRVYVTDRVAEPKQMERVHCFDAGTGQRIWTYAYECIYRKVGYPNGPRASVAVDDGRAYSLGTMGDLLCLDAEEGGVLWRRDLKADYRIRIPTWGIAASPLVEGDLVIVHVGGRDGACLIAFDKETGKERWRALDDRPSYSSPIIIEQAGKRVLVCLTGDRVVGLDPQSGELYWHSPFPPARMVDGIATPVIEDNFLLVSGFYDGSLLLRLETKSLAAIEVWRRRGPSERKTDSLHALISTPLIMRGYIYGVDSYGELRCLDLRTGDRIWESLKAVPKARWSTIHFVRNGERIWMFNERGELIISKLSPEGFEEISRAKLIDPTKGQLSGRGGVCWSHPAFAYKRVFARNDDELICVSLAVD